MDITLDNVVEIAINKLLETWTHVEIEEFVICDYLINFEDADQTVPCNEIERKDFLADWYGAEERIDVNEAATLLRIVDEGSTATAEQLREYVREELLDYHGDHPDDAILLAEEFEFIDTGRRHELLAECREKGICY